MGKRVANLLGLIPGTRPSEPADAIEDWIASGLHPRRRACAEPSTYQVAWCRFCDTPIPWTGRKPYCDVDQDGQECCETKYKRMKRHERYEATLARVQVEKVALRELHRLRNAVVDSVQTFVEACATERDGGLPVSHFLIRRQIEIRAVVTDAKALTAHIRTLPRPGPRGGQAP